jgi:hypothetical protein
MIRRSCGSGRSWCYWPACWRPGGFAAPRLDALVARLLGIAAVSAIAVSAIGRGLHGRPTVSVIQLIELGFVLSLVGWALFYVLTARAGYFAYFVIAFVRSKSGRRLQAGGLPLVGVERQQYVGDVGIELVSAMDAELVERVGERERGAVGAVGGHRVECVAAGHDPGFDGDRVAGQSVRVAESVVALVA